MMMRMAKTYLSAPESFEAANDDGNDYVQRFKHFLLANRVTESWQKNTSVPYINLCTYVQVTVKPYRSTRS